MDGYEAEFSSGVFDIVPLSEADRPPSGATHAVQFTASGATTEYEVRATASRYWLPEFHVATGFRGGPLSATHCVCSALTARSCTHARARRTFV